MELPPTAMNDENMRVLLSSTDLIISMSARLASSLGFQLPVKIVKAYSK